jgi:hypothetical protein
VAVFVAEAMLARREWLWPEYDGELEEAARDDNDRLSW